MKKIGFWTLFLIMFLAAGWFLLFAGGLGWLLQCLKLPWMFHVWLVSGFMAGKISVWTALAAGFAEVMLLSVPVLVCGGILRNLGASGAFVAVAAWAWGLACLAAVIYFWTFPPYSWATVLVRIVWSWFFCIGGVWQCLMILMIGEKECRS